MKKKLYIETSVWNQLEHDDRPEWRQTAKKFMDALRNGIYEPYISDIVIKEIEATPSITLQKKLVQHINNINPVVIPASEEVELLTEKYLLGGFGKTDSLRIYNDCSHVAMATVTEIRHIVSFNCKHLVNDHRIDVFNAINFQNGYDLMIDITMPHKFVMDEEKETK
jgi:predicted nucleic acid-binding protein